FNLDEANNTEEKLTKKANYLTVQVDQLTDEKKKNEQDLEKLDKMINDLNAESIRTELDQEKKDHTKTQLIKGKYENDIAEIIVRAETFEKNVHMAEQEKVKTIRDYKAASEELMRTNTELDEKQDECDKLEDDMSEMKTELEALEQVAKTYIITTKCKETETVLRINI
ncbi:myosin heavy chain, partial [Entamoeba invadens IP1]